MNTVMLIDDDIVVIDLLKTLLKMEGYEVITDTGGSQTEDNIRKENPDVVLLDVYLNASKKKEDPVGLNILKRMREDSDFADIKVIMTSGMDFKAKSLSLGAEAFLHKPYMPEDLINTIKDLIS